MKKIALIVALGATFGLSAEKSPGAFSRGDGYWSTKADERASGMLQKLTSPTSQCENWYKVMPYIAEFWCTLSNIPMLAVGAYYRSPELLLAGTASAVSHAVPKNWLNKTDIICAALAASKVIRTYPVLLNHPWLLVPIAITGGLQVIDQFWGRKNGTCVPHVLWHCAVAVAGGMYLARCT
jgi:hypothetical protein